MDFRWLGDFWVVAKRLGFFSPSFVHYLRLVKRQRSMPIKLWKNQVILASEIKWTMWRHQRQVNNPRKRSAQIYWMSLKTYLCSFTRGVATFKMDLLYLWTNWKSPWILNGDALWLWEISGSWGSRTKVFDKNSRITKFAIGTIVASLQESGRNGNLKDAWRATVRTLVGFTQPGFRRDNVGLLRNTLGIIFVAKSTLNLPLPEKVSCLST